MVNRDHMSFIAKLCFVVGSRPLFSLNRRFPMKTRKRSIAVCLVMCLVAGLAILLPGTSVRSQEGRKTPASRVVWHHVARALLNPSTGTGQVIGYLSQIDGVTTSLFSGTPSEATAFFTFRTDTFSFTPLANNGDIQLTLLSPGKLNVYFNPSPANDWSQPDSFSSGQLIATFSRAETMLIAFGPLQTDTASFELESTQNFTFDGQKRNLKTLDPHGVTLTNTTSNTVILTGIAGLPVAFAFAGHAIAIGNPSSE
jgi:hypothetical protein